MQATPCAVQARTELGLVGTPPHRGTLAEAACKDIRESRLLACGPEVPPTDASHVAAAPLVEDSKMRLSWGLHCLDRLCFLGLWLALSLSTMSLAVGSDRPDKLPNGNDCLIKDGLLSGRRRPCRAYEAIGISDPADRAPLPPLGPERTI